MSLSDNRLPASREGDDLVPQTALALAGAKFPAAYRRLSSSGVTAQPLMVAVRAQSN